LETLVRARAHTGAESLVISAHPEGPGADSEQMQRSAHAITGVLVPMPGATRLILSAEATLAPGNTLPAALVPELRTDHAGETGAVMIYRGILAVTRDTTVKAFAQQHLATEAEHLAVLEQLLAPWQRSRLLPLWRMAGWLTGALPACFGPRAVYATVEAVETFVDQHYTDQIELIGRLDPGRTQAALQSLRCQLASLRADEIDHRNDAAARFERTASPPSYLLGWWIRAVGTGSRWAVTISRRV